MAAEMAGTQMSPSATDQRRIGVPVENLAKLEKEVKRLARRAKRLDIPPPTLTVLRHEPWVQDRRIVNQGTSDESERVVWVPANQSSTPLTIDTPARMVAVVDISMTEVRLNGWRLGAYIDHKHGDKGTFHAFKGFSHLEAIYGGSEPVCEHCGTKRERNKTYIVQHEDGGLVQVGSGCLTDFVGDTPSLSVAQWVNYWGNWDSVEHDFLRSLWVTDATFMPRVYPLVGVIAATVAFTRQNGWVSRQQAGQDPRLVATSDSVKEYALSLDPDYRERILPGGIKDTDYEEARRTLKLTRERLLTAEADRSYSRSSDYELNLRGLVSHDYISDHQFGLAASVVSYLRNAIARETKQAQFQAAHATSQWFGIPGEREMLNLTLVGIRSIEVESVRSRDRYQPESQTLYIHTFQEGRGEAVWITAKELPRELIGKQLKVKATIKEHKEFRGTKQTNISRVTVISPDLSNHLEPQAELSEGLSLA